MTDANTLRETRDALSSLGRDDLADNLDGEFNDQIEETQRVVEIKQTIAQAEEAGLGDDPAVESLREQVEALREDAGVVPETAPARMAEDFDLSEEALASMSEDPRAQLRADLSVMDEIEGGRVEVPSRHELNRRRDRVAETLSQEAVDPADLPAESAPTAREELAEALAAEEASLSEPSGTPRQRTAQLRDRVDDLEEDLREAETATLRLALEEKKDRLTEQLDKAESEV